MGTALVLIVIAALCWMGWRVSIRRWPYTRCSTCSGTGRTAGSTKDRFGLCPKCGGNGRRLRIGARSSR